MYKLLLGQLNGTRLGLLKSWGVVGAQGGGHPIVLLAISEQLRTAGGLVFVAAGIGKHVLEISPIWGTASRILAFVGPPELLSIGKQEKGLYTILIELEAQTNLKQSKTRCKFFVLFWNFISEFPLSNH